MKIAVIVHPNNKNPRVEKDLFENLHVYVNAPPLEGKANIAAIKSLSEYFQTSTTNVRLVSGFKSKHKIFEIFT